MRITEDRCRYQFQLKGDDAKGVVRICGALGSICRRTGHKDPNGPRGDEGVYDTITTNTYVDGLKESYRTLEEEKAFLADESARRSAVMARLQGQVITPSTETKALTGKTTGLDKDDLVKIDSEMSAVKRWKAFVAGFVGDATGVSAHPPSKDPPLKDSGRTPALAPVKRSVVKREDSADGATR